jgi:purine-binding chemotaxis protein CheW
LNQTTLNRTIDTDTQGQIAMFHVGAENFGISINIIKEIVRYPKITFVPKAPDYLTGLANLRGKVLPVIDSRKRLGMETAEVTDNTRVLVIDTGSSSMGVVVDKVAGVISIENMTVENPPLILTSGIDTHYINSVIKSEDGEKIIMELDVDSLCAIEFSQLAKETESEIINETEAASKTGIEENQLVTFLVSHEEYGFPIDKVREVLRVGNITEVPNVRDYVVGILTVRNSILPVLDIRKLFAMRSLVDELESEFGIMTKSNKTWLDGFKQASETSSNFYGCINAEDSMLGKWIESFRTASEEIGKVLQELRYANLKVYEVAATLLLKKKELSAEGIRKILDLNLIPCFNILETKIEELKNAIKKGIREDQRILVIEINGMPVGILVDRMQQVIRIPVNILENPPRILSTDKSEALKSIVKLNNGKRIILLLDENKVVTNQHITELQEMKADMNNESEKVSSNTVTKNDEIQLVTFRLGKEEFAIGIEEVQEINRIDKITSVPQAPSFVEGVMNLRGNVIPAIDLRKRFDMEKKQHDESTRVIIVNMNGKLTGLIVDSVSEVLRMPKGSIELAPEIIRSKVETEYIKGVGKIRDTNRMIILIAVDKILSLDELKQLNKTSNDKSEEKENKTEGSLEAVTNVTSIEQGKPKGKPEGKSLKKAR